MAKNKYDSTVARIAGNILSGAIGPDKSAVDSNTRRHMVYDAVLMARAIVAEVERTEPREAERTQP